MVTAIEGKICLKRYRLQLDRDDLPVVIRRSATEATFRGEDVRSRESVAVQIVPPAALGPVAPEQVEAEAKKARELQHINIPALRDFGFDNWEMIYVTEYFDGTTAADWLKTRGPMPVGAVLRIAQQVMNAISFATSHGIVHRAINPDNIMLVPGETNEGEWPLIKVLNLVGVAPDLTPLESTDAFQPSQFASPEQKQTGEVDFRSQIYSLGATLWSLLTGAAPPEDAASVHDTSRLPLAVKNLIAHLLASDPAKRPRDPGAFQSLLQDCRKQLDWDEPIVSVSKPASPRPAIVPKAIGVSYRAVSFPWRPIVFAAVLISLAAVAAVRLSGHLGQKESPVAQVTVPEKPTRKASAPAVAARNPSLSATPNKVVVSTPIPSARPVVAAASPPQAKPSATPQIVTANSLSAPSHIEAPPSALRLDQVAEGPSPAPSQKAVAQNRKEDVAVVKSNPAVAKPEERPKARVAESAEQSSSSLPGTRAQFLGTTPDGNLVFGLPSSEKVSVAPPSVDISAEGPRRSTPRPSPSPPTLDGLPVLRALPVDH